MSQAKLLKNGVAVADANGHINAVSVSELAKLVGEELGVYRVSYNVTGPGWIRIANLGISGAVVQISNTYDNKRPYANQMLVSTSYGDSTSAINNFSICASTSKAMAYNKVRLVSKNYDTYLEVYSTAEEGKKNTWYVSVISPKIKGAICRFEVYDTQTPGDVPEGFFVKEWSLSEIAISGGG